VWLGFVSIDAYLALAIAVYFGYTSIHLVAARTSELLDRAPAELQGQVKAIVRAVEGVQACDRVRLRKSGSKLFVDLVITVDHSVHFVASHRIASNVEKAVKKVFRDSDVVVHVQPASFGKDILDKVREVALKEGASDVHGVEIEAQGKKQRVSFDLEFSRSTSFKKAHEISSKVESELRKAFPEISIVTTHLEPEEQKLGAAEIKSKTLVERIRKIALTRKGVRNCHNIYVTKTGEELHVSMHCNFNANLSVVQVHEISTDLEEDIKRHLKKVAIVTIHSEPVSKKS
jgi:divalent metal cation (Fe/Co/Zn/Cd) transporter